MNFQEKSTLDLDEERDWYQVMNVKRRSGSRFHGKAMMMIYYKERRD
jgi:hypothetical protein